MAAQIHPTAVVDPSAVLGDGVVVGPLAVVGAQVEVGAGTEIGPGAHLQGPTKIGRENRLYPTACVGLDPQDLKFAGEETRLEVGDRNVFREGVTIHRGTGKGGGLTVVGSDGLYMVGAHVAHDCKVGDRVIFANQGTLAGHVEVGDDATVGAFSAVHQFARVGAHAYIGGFSVITRDALPYVKTVGQKPACYGLNRIGLERKGFSPEALKRLQAAYRILVKSRLATPTALEQLRELGDFPELRLLVDFVAGSGRGVIRDLPGGGGRGGGAGEAEG